MQDFPSYVVLFDDEQQALFESSIVPHMQEGWATAPFHGFDKDTLPQQSHVLFWLGDKDLYKAISSAQAQNWSVGFLPHPDMNRFYLSFNVPNKIEDAILDITETQMPVSIDLLYCNDKLVLSSVMLGNPEIMSPAANMDNSIWTKFQYLAVMMTRLNKVRLYPYRLETAKGSVVNTAALGLSCLYRPRNSSFTKHLISDDEIDKATLDTMILAPRSISETLRFLFSRLFPKIQINQGLACYIGHIKTKSITISGDEPLLYSIDGEDFIGDFITVSVKNDALNVLSQRLPEQSTSVEEKESIRVAEIPTGNSIKELTHRSLPWIHHFDFDEVKETFVNLKESAKISESYLVLMVLSTLMAAVGLFANSAPVIIGAMILAPLMAPIVSLSMGVLRQDSGLLFTALKTLSLGVFLALLFSALFTQMMPLHTVTLEISARLSPTILDLAVAIIAGIAGAYANARSEVAKSLAGVAIAVALVPPLAVAGIGISWLDWHTFSAGFLLFATNLAGIVLASSVTFLFMGFSPFHLAKKGVIIALSFVVIVSVPLSLSFNKLVEKQQIIDTLEEMEFANLELKEVQLIQQTPLYVSVTLLSNQEIKTPQLDEVKKQIETRLNRKIQLESKVAILR